MNPPHLSSCVYLVPDDLKSDGFSTPLWVPPPFSHDASYLRETWTVVEEASRGSPTANPGGAAVLLAALSPLSAHSVDQA